MMNDPDVYRRLADMIRIGVVHEVRHTKPPRCRVADGDLLTGWLPWIELRAGELLTWNPPSVGEQCVLLAPNGNLSAAVVLVGINSDQHPAPGDKQGQHLQHYSDGGRIDYDRETGALDIEVPDGGQITFRCAGSSIVLSSSGIKLTADRIDLN